MVHASFLVAREHPFPERIQAMTPMFFILSCPVHVQDGAFGVMSGTAAGTHFRQFGTLRRAKRYQTMQRMLWCAAADVPIDLVLIEDVSDSAALTARFEQEYALRALPRPICVAALSTPNTLLERLATRFLGLRTPTTVH
jgi:hypothetical protein